MPLESSKKKRKRNMRHDDMEPKTPRQRKAASLGRTKRKVAAPSQPTKRQRVQAAVKAARGY